MDLVQIHIISYRSIINLKIDLSNNNLNTLCGANNVGKTNILRAINSFFKGNNGDFSVDDIPNHVEHGSRGSSRKADIKATFKQGDKNFDVSVVYTPPVSGKGETTKVTGKTYSNIRRSKKIDITEAEAAAILESFRVFFIEANKTDINNVIQNIFINDVLPVIDKARAKKVESTKALENFQTTTQILLQGIESDLSKNLESFVIDVEGISSQNWKIEIPFPAVNVLRNAISKLVTLTVNDANDKSLEFKGSGVQKVILLAIMRYISSKNDEKVLWLIDEPEAFLQPALQKEVFQQLSVLSQSFSILVTTHSPHFIDLAKLESSFLVKANREPKQYGRKSTKKYMAIFTYISDRRGYEKIEEIRKHLGVESNDSWILTPFNLIVEGEEDKKYISTLLKKYNKETPNILIAGGASKIKAFCQFVNMHAKDIGTKPKVICIFDYDDAGIEGFKGVQQSKLSDVVLEKIYVKRSDASNDTNLRFEFEDMLPLDLVLEAANAYLQKRKYTKIKKTSLDSRYQRAFNSQSILDILTNLASAKNPTKDQINFSHVGAKLFIMKHICDNIDSMDIAQFSLVLDNNMGLKDFLDTVSG